MLLVTPTFLMQEVLLALLWRGANLRLKDMRGQSALLAAVVGGHREVVDLLIAQGARLEMEPLMLVRRAWGGGGGVQKEEGERVILE
jgi:hypothetical protein